MNISYLEIYNDSGYDLLDENHATKSLFDLPKVRVYELNEDQYVLKNLSVHRAENEEDALNLLFIGDTNRVVSETPKNDASTRSHCVFMIQLECQKNGEDVKTVSKLHLVDLAGSERPSVTGIDGKTLEEAKNINLTLHYLAQVIEALNEKAKGNPVTHVPYRNSMMTQILKDSLGGNCRTKMVATISAERGDVLESLSTCRFAKRVSKIQNLVSRNEQVDPGVIITRLKREVAELKAEIALLKGADAKEELAPEDIDKCNKMVERFIASTDPSDSLVLSDRLLIGQCFAHFKHLFRDLQKRGGGSGVQLSQPAGDGLEAKRMQEEVQRLQMLVQQRDNEIGILLNYLNKKKGDESTGVARASQSTEETKSSFSGGGGTLYQMMTTQSAKTSDETRQEIVQGGVYENPKRSQADKELMEANQMTNGAIAVSYEDLADRTKAFDLFRRSYRKNEAMDENREVLKQKFQRGKELGNLVN